MSGTTEDAALNKLRLLYGMTARRDTDNDTWWIGSELRPDLLNLDSPQDAVTYLDQLPQQMVDNLMTPRGFTEDDA